MCVVRGPDLQCEAVNAPFLELVNGADVVGQSIIDAVPDLAAQGYAACARHAMEHGIAAVQDDVRLERRGSPGDASYWRFVHTPIRGDDGHVTRVVAAGTDITHQVLARRGAEAVAADLTSFFENSAVALHWVAADGTILRANRAELALLGFTAEEYVGRHIADFHVDRDVIDDILRRLAAGETLHDYPARVHCKDGTIKHVLIDCNAEWGSDGAFLHSRCFTRDVTARVLSEQRVAGDLAAMTRMQHVSTRLVQASGFGALLDEILEAAIDITNADKGNVQLLHDGALKIVAQRGFDRAFVDFFDTVHAGEAACGVAMQRGARVIVDDVATGAIFAGSPARDVLLAADVRAVQSSPLISRSGALLGMFSTHYRRASRPTDEALRVLDVLARQAADLIERARAEQALRESESRFRQIADGLPVVVSLLEFDGASTFVSAAWQGLTGQSPERGLGFGWLDAVHPGDRARAREAFSARPGNADAFDLEFRVRRQDGEDRSALAVVTPRLGTSGQPRGYVASVIDITERKRNETARARLAAIVDSADDAIVSKTLDGVILSWNRGAERIFGWTETEAVGRHITLIIPDERRAEEDEILARIRRGESVDHFETVRVARDGRRLDIALTVSPVRDRNGRIIGASKIARDVTERRRLEAARAHLAAIIDSADDAIVSKSLEGVIRTWNRGAERIFGWTAEEAVGRHITLIIPPERHPEEDQILARIRQGETLAHFETVRVAKDGRRLDISLTVSPVRDRDGRIVAASKIARDVTERRRLEDERDRLLIEAEASNRAKDHLLATVSHELRTPLNSILGYARLLESGSLDEGAQLHAVGVIARNAMTQAQLIDDLLDLSRLATGRMQLTFDRCDLGEIVDSALEIVQPSADAKGVAVTVQRAPAGAAIRGAAERLRQVVWNLLSNAIKFTPRGGHVDVTVTSTDSHAELVVSDDGVGISATALPHVFELFRQEDSSSTRGQGGLGLGLALVKSLVDLHGGYVTAESEGKGKGARFTVGLPLAPPGGDALSRER